MSIYDQIRDQLSVVVPFANHTGVEMLKVEKGVATARLAQAPSTVNHIGSQHAGALFTLGEAASGGAMAGAIGEQMMSVRPVAAEAQISYVKIAKGTITAVAKTSIPAEEIRARLNAEGKIKFDVDVRLFNELEQDVATMKVAWHLKKI